jgi:5-carboxymethyl-2-hydroxymuconate isomerase
MPHLMIEYSGNLEDDFDVATLLKDLHGAALATGVFPIGGLRSRLVPRAQYRIGDGHPDNRFIHVQARIGAGRDVATRERVADALFDALKAATAMVFERHALGLTLEIVEIDPAGARKHNNLHEIIAARQEGSLS